MTDTIATQPELSALVAGLADNKNFLGHRYAEWCTAAPSLESAVAAAAMAQDEIGHARSLYPLLKDLSGDSPESEPETRTRFANLAFLNQPFETWTDFVAVNFVFDTAITSLLEYASDSSLQSLSQRARRILEEERLHWLHAEGWIRRLAPKGHVVRQALERSLSRVTPETLSWFDVATPALVERGVLREPGDQIRLRFRTRVNRVLESVTLPPI